MTKRKKRTQLAPEQWYPGFLAILRQTGNVMLSCANVGIDRSTVYKHRQGNDAFAAEWELAMADAGDGLEAEARRRAVVGVEDRKLILYKGEPVINWQKPGQWVDDQGKPWEDGKSKGRKRWSGEFLYEVKIRYSDSLLTLLLKGAKQDVYGDTLKVKTEELDKEAARLAAKLGITVEELIAEARALQAEKSAGR